MSTAQLQRLLQEAVGHHHAGRLADAEKLYARARAAAPKNFDALHLSGLVALQQGRSREAADLLRRALRLNPASAVCEMRLAAARLALGELAAAEKHLRAAVVRAPDLPEAWCNLGIVLKTSGQLAGARTAFERAVKLKPDYAEGHERLGAIVSEIEGFAEALPHFRRTAQLLPNTAGALANLGVALAQTGAPEEALGWFDRALALESGHPLALTGRALAYQETYRIHEAVAGYGEVLAKNPRNLPARSGRLFALHYLDNLSREALFNEHVAFGAAVADSRPRLLPNIPGPERRLRLAFLSPDLRTHSVAYFLEPLLAHLDPGQFEIFLYHHHPRMDGMSARLRAHATTWRHFAGLSDDAVEAAIRSDAPDVLVDLAGHTGINRLALFARRLAPVQLTYLGYPDTSGLREMDYRFVDPITDPVGEADQFHSEKLIRFAPTAWSYAPPAEAPHLAAGPGAAGGPVTFGCFNNFAKVSESTLRGWSRVLAAVPGSCLLLKGHGLAEPALAARLRVRLAELGVEEGRVELLARTPNLATHLALYARVDIALDTFPYHGTTTTCEALWMGRPVVTLLGDRHASRVGASLLTAAGHPEWIAADWDGYVRIAAELAGAPGRLQNLGYVLRDELRASPLLDHAGQASRFGAAVRKCWVAWCARLHETAA